jgi:hypothetical protein
VNRLRDEVGVLGVLAEIGLRPAAVVGELHPDISGLGLTLLSVAAGDKGGEEASSG